MMTLYPLIGGNNATRHTRTENSEERYHYDRNTHSIIRNSLYFICTIDMKKLVFFDVESTGANENRDDEIVQIYYTATHPTWSWTIWRWQYFRSTKPISYWAMAMHHITNEDVKTKQPFQGSVEEQEIREYLNEWRIFVAHNIAFDAGMLDNYGINLPRSQQICTMKLARHIFYGVDECEQFSLQYLRYFLWLQFAIHLTPHDAHSDVTVLTWLYSNLINRLCSKYEIKDADEAIQKAVQITKENSLLYKIPFGKYRGERFEDIAKKDPGYFQRCLDKMDNLSDDQRYTIKHYLLDKVHEDVTLVKNPLHGTDPF